MSYGNARPPSLQEILNQPFEFQEVLLSPKERVRIQKGLDSSQLFVLAGGDAGAGGLMVNEYRLREISVRLRTINNACDSMATLPDGTPISEVSLYGSRERQYLVGPYKALKRLMSGESPYDANRSRIESLGRLKEQVAQSIKSVEALLKEPEELPVAMQMFSQPVRKPSPQEIEWARASKVDYQAMQERCLILESRLSDQPKNWWEPWSSESDVIEHEMEQVRSILSQLSESRRATHPTGLRVLRDHVPSK